MTEQQLTTAPMGHDDPYKTPAVKAELAAKKAAAEAALDKPGKVDQQGLGGAAGHGETRRLSTPPLPVRFESKEVKIYGLQYDASVLGLPTLHLLRKGQLDLVLADKDVERMAGSGIRFDAEHGQFFVDDKPVLKDGTTFPVNWIVKANGRIPQAFVRVADTKLNPVPPAEPDPATAAPLALSGLAVPAPGEQVVKIEDKPVNDPDDDDMYVTTGTRERTEQALKAASEANDFLPSATLADAQAAHDNAPEAKPFVWDDKARKTFFQEVNPLMKAAGIEVKDQDAFRHQAMGGSLKEYQGTPAQAKALIQAALEKYPRTERKEQPVTTPVEPNTTETALAVVEPIRLATGTTLFPVRDEWEMMRIFASAAITSGLLPPGIKTVEAALYIIETGRELGLPPSVALRKISIIQGQPTLAAELMLAMVKARGNRTGELEQLDIVKDETPGAESCTVTMKRKGEAPYTTTYTIAHAKKQQLAGKDSWIKQPGTMCKWRAVSDACRTVFPDYTLGVYGAEELDDNQD